MTNIQCIKRAYESKNIARREQKWIERKGKNMRIYFCDHNESDSPCFMWHLTSEVDVKHGFKYKRKS